MLTAPLAPCGAGPQLSVATASLDVGLDASTSMLFYKQALAAIEERGKGYSPGNPGRTRWGFSKWVDVGSLMSDDAVPALLAYRPWLTVECVYGQHNRPVASSRTTSRPLLPTPTCKPFHRKKMLGACSVTA